MANDNFFERRRDIAARQFGRMSEVTDKTFGVGQRPYGEKQLAPAERIAYFASRPLEKQRELFGQMEEPERREIVQGMANQAGG